MKVKDIIGKWTVTKLTKTTVELKCECGATSTRVLSAFRINRSLGCKECQRNPFRRACARMFGRPSLTKDQLREQGLLKGPYVNTY